MKFLINASEMLDLQTVKRLLLVSVMLTASTVLYPQKKGELLPADQKKWISLMDPSDWRGYNYTTNELPPHWSFSDGMIVCNGAGGGMDGDIVSMRNFDDFELYLEWKLAPGGNSGVFYHVIENQENKAAYETGPEYQLLDDLGFPGRENLHPSQFTASDYDMYPAPLSKNVKPAGEWNETRIVFRNRKVQYYLNGTMTVEFKAWDEDWYARKAKSKWAGYPHWGVAGTGRIGLQDHGSGVWFRNVKIRAL